jgi:hypothetical protein
LKANAVVTSNPKYNFMLGYTLSGYCKKEHSNFPSSLLLILGMHMRMPKVALNEMFEDLNSDCHNLIVEHFNAYGSIDYNEDKLRRDIITTDHCNKKTIKYCSLYYSPKELIDMGVEVYDKYNEITSLSKYIC